MSTSVLDAGPCRTTHSRPADPAEPRPQSTVVPGCANPWQSPGNAIGAGDGLGAANSAPWFDTTGPFGSGGVVAAVAGVGAGVVGGGVDGGVGGVVVADVAAVVLGRVVVVDRPALAVVPQPGNPTAAKPIASPNAATRPPIRLDRTRRRGGVNDRAPRARAHATTRASACLRSSRSACRGHPRGSATHPVRCRRLPRPRRCPSAR